MKQIALHPVNPIPHFGIVAILAIAANSFAVTLETTKDLNVYYPEYSKIDLVCGQMPKTSQKDVVFLRHVLLALK